MTSSCGNGDGPISGVCIVADHTRAPAGYTVIRKAYDDPTREADLHRDGLFRRIDRYMCVTRHPFPNVVEDIILVNASDSPPPGYTPLLTTVDTNESTTAKRTICVRMSQRSAGLRAVGDIIFLSKQKRPPPGYSLVGEINGLLMCIREWLLGEHCPANVPISAVKRISHSESQSPQTFQGRRLSQAKNSSLYPTAEKLLLGVAGVDVSLNSTFDAMTIQRDDFGWAIIAKVPFHFKKLIDEKNEKCPDGLLSFPPLHVPQLCADMEEINRKYNYEFRLEKAWVS